MITSTCLAVYHHMEHPNIIDKLKHKINPHYLYLGELVYVTSNLNVAIVHKVSSSHTGLPHWKIMDYLNLKKGSLLKYLGPGKKYKLSGDLTPKHSLFEAMNIYSDKLTGNGDILALTDIDHRFLTPNSLSEINNSKSPIYFTAEDK